jgi:hypothetical protein
VLDANDSSQVEARASEQRPASGTNKRSRRVGKLAAVVLVVSLTFAAASPAFADRYDKRQAGHPLRIVAYILYPVGALLEALIVRPAHWVVSQEPLKSSVGHED